MGKGSTRRPLLISETKVENNWSNIFKRKENSHDVSPHAYEYELNKSTGEVEKRFKEGTSKPNKSQFDGD